MGNIKAIFKVSVVSYFKIPAIIGTTAFLVLLPLVFYLITQDGEASSAEFVNMFAPMFVGLGTVGTASSFVMGDKVTMNLRFMSMAGVKPFQYLVGTGGALLVISFGVMAVYSQIAGYRNEDLAIFLALGTFGASIAILLGMSIGMFKFPWLGQPIGMLLAFGTMFSEVNETLAAVFYFTFTQQLHNAFSALAYEYGYVSITQVMPIMLGNAIVVLLLFVLINWKHGLYKV